VAFPELPTGAPTPASTGRVSDAELVDRARKGDGDAFGLLVERHRASVYRAALAALRSPAEAEDAAQDAFVRAYRRLGSFRGEATFKTWLVSIAWRQALSRRRRLASAWRRFWPEGEADEAPAPEGSPESALLGAERAATVARLVRALPARLQEPLLLFATGDHTYEEMAVILDIPSGTLKGRVAEARRRVIERMERMGLGHE
jgi:RNA polymerase sigma-70 factor, ECF subfamily